MHVLMSGTFVHLIAQVWIAKQAGKQDMEYSLYIQVSVVIYVASWWVTCLSSPIVIVGASVTLSKTPSFIDKNFIYEQ